MRLLLLMASMPNHWSWRAQELTDFHRVTTAAAVAADGQGGGGLSGVFSRLQADFSMFKSRSETMRLERKTLAMDHLSASHARFWRAKRCLLQQSVRDEAIHRLNPHLDHRRAGEEGGTLGGATNKKRWWKKTSFELAPKNGTTFLRGGRVWKRTSHSTK